MDNPRELIESIEYIMGRYERLDTTREDYGEAMFLLNRMFTLLDGILYDLLKNETKQLQEGK